MTAGSSRVKVSLPSSTSCFPVRVVPLSSRALVQRDLGPVEAFCGSCAEGVAVPIGLLAAGEDEGRFFFLGDLREDLAQGDGIEAEVSFDVDGAVYTHGEGGAESVLRAAGADGDGDDLGLDAALAKAEGLLDAVFVHGVHHELAVFESDGVVGDVYALFRIEDLANKRQYAHGFTLVPLIPVV